MNKVEKLNLMITYVIRMTLAVALISSIITNQWVTLFLSTLTLLLTFLPAFLTRKSKIRIPVEFEFVIIFFLYASLYLGEIRSYYFRFWWWDFVMHGAAAIILGITGFLIVYILNHEESFHMGPKFVALFTFTFAMALGGVWEIFEFGIDSVLGVRYMQKSGLLDTMGDLIIDAIGALIASIIGFLYVKKGYNLVLTRVINRFVKENPWLF